MTDLRALLERVQKAQGPDRELDIALDELVFVTLPHGSGVEKVLANTPYYTHSIDASVGLVSKLLPDWWWSCGYCKLSNDASIVPRASMAPDFRASPEAHALVNKSRKFDEGFHCDLRYGNVPIALMTCLLMAMIAKAELEEGVGEF